MKTIVPGCWVVVMGDMNTPHLVISVDESGNVTLSTGDVVSVWLCERVG